MEITCPACLGTKIYNDMPCIVCGATGVSHVNEDALLAMICHGDIKIEGAM